MKLKHKIGGAVLALALAAGAMPSMISKAQAYENPNGGQHFDRGRFPRTYHIVIMAAAATIALIVLTAKSNDKPTSP